MIDDHGVSRYGKRRRLAEGIYHSRIQIRNEDHVALLHHRVSIVGRVETDAVLQRILGKLPRRYGHMAVLAVNIHDLKIDHLDMMVLDHFHETLDCH